MTGLIAARVLAGAWSWRRAILFGAFLLLAVPALAAAGLMSLLDPAPSGSLVDPLPGSVVTQPFGCTGVVIEPIDMRCLTHHFHTGVDLAAPLHSPIRAASAGIVLTGDSPTGYGLYVVIQRDPTGDLATLYGHLSVALVQSGDLVQAGEWIGLVGSTGNSTGPHLHFEVRVRGVPVDPAPFLPLARAGGGR